MSRPAWAFLARRRDEAYSWILGGAATQPGAARWVDSCSELPMQTTSSLSEYSRSARRRSSNAARRRAKVPMASNHGELDAP